MDKSLVEAHGRFNDKCLNKLEFKHREGFTGWDVCAHHVLADMVVQQMSTKLNSDSYIDIANLVMMLYTRGTEPAYLKGALNRYVGEKVKEAFDIVVERTANQYGITAEGWENGIKIAQQIMGEFLEQRFSIRHATPTVAKKPQEPLEITEPPQADDGYMFKIKFSDVPKMNDLYDRFQEIQRKIDHLPGDLGVTIYGTYQKDPIVDAVRPVVEKFLRGQQQEIIDELRKMGVAG